MDIIGSGHMRRLKERIDFLENRINQSEVPSGYDSREVKALGWALRKIESQENDPYYKRAYNNGQKTS